MKSCLILLEGTVTAITEDGTEVPINWRVVNKGRVLGSALEFYQEQRVMGYFLLDCILELLESEREIPHFFVSIGKPGCWEIVRISSEEVTSLFSKVVESLDDEILFGRK